jgi:hypothetical protein
MDNKLVASKQRHEIDSVVTMLRKKNPGVEINRVTVKDIFWNTGRSRVIAYAIFRLMGYDTARTKKATKVQEKKIKEIAEKMGL